MKKKRLLHLLWIAPLSLVGLVFWLNSDSGRDFLRRRVVAFVNEEVLAGKLEIASIDGSLFSDLHIRGIVVEDAAGKRAVEIEDVHLAYRPGELIRGRIQVDALEIVRPIVRAELLATLTRPSEEETPEPPADPSEPPELDVQLARFAVIGGELYFNAAEVRPLELVASATISGPAIFADLTFHGGDAELLIEQTPTQGRVHLSVPADLIRAFAGDPALSLDLLLDAKLSRGSVLPWHVELDGAISGAPLEGLIDAGLDRAELALSLRGFDPRRVHADAPRAELGLKIEAGARLDGTILQATTALAVSSTTADSLRIDANASVELARVVAVRSSSVSIAVRSAKTFVPLDAELQVNASAVGPVDDLSARLAVKGIGVTAPGLRVDQLALDATLQHLPARASGEAVLRIAGLDAGALKFDDTKATVRIADGARTSIDLRANGPSFLRGLSLSATATQSPLGVGIELARLIAETSSASWTAKDAKIALGTDGRITIENFALTSEAGAIRARGKIEGGRPVELEAAIEKLQLGALAGFAPALAGLTGQIDLDAAVHGTSARIDLDARAIQRDQTEPLDASVHARLEQNGAITASISAGGSGIGTLAIDAAGRAPKDPFDGAAWPKEARIEKLRADIPGIDLSRLLAFTGTTVLVSGRVSGQAHVGKDLRDADVKLAVRGLSTPALALPADLDLSLELGPTGSKGRLTASFENAPVMNIDLDSTAGSDAFRRLGVKALEQRGAELHLAAENVPAGLLAILARLDPKDPRFAAPRGRVSLWVDAKGAPPDVAVVLRVAAERFAFVESAPDLKLDLRAELGGGQLRSTLRAVLGRELGSASVELAAAVPKLADVEAWKTIDQRALRALEVGVDAFELRAIEELGLAKVPPGTLDVRVVLSSVEGPGRATITLKNLKATPEVAPLDLALAATFGPRAQTVSATISTGQTHVLELAATINAGLEALLLGRERDPRFIAEARVPKLPLDQLLTRDAMKRAVRGELELVARAGGRVSAPTSSVTFALENTKLGGVPFDTFAGTAYADKKTGAQAKLELAARGGSLRVNAAAPPGGKLHAILDAKKFGLTFLSGLAKTLGGSAIGVDGFLDGQSELAQDQVRGRLEISSMRLVLPGAPSIEKARLAIELAGDRGKIDLKGEIGKGALDLQLALRLPSLTELDVDGALTIDDMHYDANGTIVAVDSSVKLNARRRGLETTASVIIGATEVTLPAEKGRALYTIRDFEDVRYVDRLGEGVAKAAVPAPEGAPSQENSKLAIKIATEKPIIARGGENALEISVDLAMTAEGAKKKLNGKVEIEQGRVSIVGKAYNFQRGLVLFDGNFPPDPKLDLRLAHDFPTLSLLVLVQGTGKKPEVRFASEPGGFDQATLLGYFLGGGPGETSEGTTEDKAKRAASGLLVSQLASKAQGGVPIDTLDVDLGDGAARAGSVSAGKWVAGDVFVAYRYRFKALDHENQSEGILRWRFARGWTLEARFGDRGEGSVDAVWLKRF